MSDCLRAEWNVLVARCSLRAASCHYTIREWWCALRIIVAQANLRWVKYRLRREGMLLRCPWHDEQTPSCYVDGSYVYCFGCGREATVADLPAGWMDESRGTRLSRRH